MYMFQQSCNTLLPVICVYKYICISHDPLKIILKILRDSSMFGLGARGSRLGQANGHPNRVLGDTIPVSGVARIRIILKNPWILPPTMGIWGGYGRNNIFNNTWCVI